MAHRVCPWWLGYLLVSPLRRLVHDPARIVGPHVREGMTVVEPGPGMGFFTLELARRVGSAGRVVAIDVQPRMLAGLRQRAARAGLAERVETRAPEGDGLGAADLDGRVDFLLAFAVVHELPDEARFFADAARLLRPGGRLLVAEPRGHVSADAFEATLARATAAGLARVGPPPRIWKSWTALLGRAP